MIDRRGMVAGIFGLAALPLATHAQSPRKAGKIGYLHPNNSAPDSPTLTILRPIWQSLGYVEGETFLARSADGDPARIPSLVAELVRQDIAALIAVGPEAVSVARRTAPQCPIVAIDLETDPIRSGYAASFNRPGGSVTGLYMDQISLATKWVELLLEAAPAIGRLALGWDPSTGTDQLSAASSAAKRKGLDTVVLEFRKAEGYDQAFQKLDRSYKYGLIQLGSPGLAIGARSLAMAAERYQLPTISFLRPYALDGMLMTYGPSNREYFGRAAVLADKIVRGEQAGDIPIEGPSRFEFVINLRTAKALGLAIPPSLLIRADEVIE
jgi:putative ABC transport system substrate-binding protein